MRERPGGAPPAADHGRALGVACFASGRRCARRGRCWVLAMREVNGADVADTTVDEKPTRRRRNWRQYEENRPSPKYVAKRVTDEAHAALTRFAKDHGTDVAKLLAPFVDDLTERAFEHCRQLDEVSEPAKAS